MKSLNEIIKTFDFEEANRLLSQLSFEGFLNELLQLAYDDESILQYAFVNGWLVQKETYDLHLLAINLLFNPLCHIEGAYRSSLYHVKRCLVLSNNKDLISLENLLFLNEVPDKVVSDEEALEVAKLILEIQSDHEIAQNLIKNIVIK
ncbi:hypothetical protein CHH65_12935 [Shouchella clausii]|uniref:hypothetical protein n=1 Tax=Shouchella clausii TaxID=79880 RepID=UPI000BA7AE79|nr:hypothetical protein [Shouchella clausii]PAF08933.1 hypothetical protein CHH65_12935 [Shouchella clausii]